MKNRPLFLILTIILLSAILSGCVSPSEISEPIDSDEIIVESVETDSEPGLEPEPAELEEADTDVDSEEGHDSAEETHHDEDGDEAAEAEESHDDEDGDEAAEAEESHIDDDDDKAGEVEESNNEEDNGEVDEEGEPSEETAEESTAESAAASEPVGPDNFPEDVNPLTGLPAENSEYLDLPPALVSISNFPASSRPQAGLGSSPITFEIAIGEGMTRFLAVFYGEFPGSISGQTEGATSNEETSEGETTLVEGEETIISEGGSIGPIRSGRLPYEDIRSAYSGFIVMASAYQGVAANLTGTSSVYGSDSDDINSALIDVDKLIDLAKARADSYIGSEFNLEGNQFSQTPPEGGKPADKVWLFYSALNQVQWRYDTALGAYVRYDITTDGSDEFIMATDRLTGAPLNKENVIVIFAEHDYQAPTLININFTNRPPTKALLFRDGKMYKINWTTQFGTYEKETGRMRPMRFVDADGNPFPLKPGQTWVNVVSLATYYTESTISELPFYPIKPEEGTGLWLVRYKGIY